MNDRMQRSGAENARRTQRFIGFERNAGCTRLGLMSGIALPLQNPLFTGVRNA